MVTTDPLGREKNWASSPKTKARYLTGWDEGFFRRTCRNNKQNQHTDLNWEQTGNNTKHWFSMNLPACWPYCGGLLTESRCVRAGSEAAPHTGEHTESTSALGWSQTDLWAEHKTLSDLVFTYIQTQFWHEPETAETPVSLIYLYVHVDTKCGQSLSHDQIVVKNLLQAANGGVKSLEVGFYLQW